MNDVPAGDWCERLLDEADEATDRRDLEAARTEKDYLFWDDVKTALGLDWTGSSRISHFADIRDLRTKFNLNLIYCCDTLLISCMRTEEGKSGRNGR